jgi:hypothetical protein
MSKTFLTILRNINFGGFDASSEDEEFLDILDNIKVDSFIITENGFLSKNIPHKKNESLEIKLDN